MKVKVGNHRSPRPERILRGRETHENKRAAPIAQRRAEDEGAGQREATRTPLGGHHKRNVADREGREIRTIVNPADPQAQSPIEAAAVRAETGIVRASARTLRTISFKLGRPPERSKSQRQSPSPADMRR